jgi:hypothetical protein
MKVGRFCVEPGLSSPKIVKFLPALPILLGDVLFSMEPAYLGRAFCLLRSYSWLFQKPKGRLWTGPSRSSGSIQLPVVSVLTPPTVL